MHAPRTWGATSLATCSQRSTLSLSSVGRDAVGIAYAFSRQLRLMEPLYFFACQMTQRGEWSLRLAAVSSCATRGNEGEI